MIIKNKKKLPVSVIIVNYNNGKYLDKCISSINNSKFPPSEIIIVDDASTDSSISIISKLKKKFENIYLIKKKKNTGASHARWMAIKKSKFDLISYIDSDDFIEKDSIFFAYNKLIKSNSDLCLFTMYRFEKNKKYKHTSNPTKPFLTNKEAVELTLGQWGIHFLGVMKKEILVRAYNEKEKKIINTYNDDEIICRLFLHFAKKITSVKKKYFYRNNQHSSTNKFNIKRFEEFETNLWIINFAKKNYPDKLHASLRWFLSLSLKFFNEGKKMKIKKTNFIIRKFLNKICDDIININFLIHNLRYFIFYFYLKFKVRK